jgi:spermidine synthase
MEQDVANRRSPEFDILTIDVFSGDAIPVHLLTKEAFEIYLHELKPDGVLGLHISNTYLDLRPVVRQLADHFGLRWAWVHAKPDAVWAQRATGCSSHATTNCLASETQPRGLSLCFSF